MSRRENMFAGVLRVCSLFKVEQLAPSSSTLKHPEAERLTAGLVYNQHAGLCESHLLELWRQVCNKLVQLGIIGHIQSCCVDVCLCACSTHKQHF